MQLAATAGAGQYRLHAIWPFMRVMAAKMAGNKRKYALCNIFALIRLAIPL
jgi:hypothetical protein